MPQGVATVDLRSLDLPSGAGTRLTLRVPPIGLRLGGQDYVTDPAQPEVELEVSRSLSGLHLRLRGHVEVVGPCWRCVADARVAVDVDSSEFQADGRDPDEPFDEDFDSQYLEGDDLDLETWSRDAVAEALPAVILCREDCAGLCPTCGIDHNTGSCDCAEVPADSRWDALRGLAERLSQDE